MQVSRQSYKLWACRYVYIYIYMFCLFPSVDTHIYIYINKYIYIYIYMCDGLTSIETSWDFVCDMFFVLRGRYHIVRIYYFPWDNTKLQDWVRLLSFRWHSEIFCHSHAGSNDSCTLVPFVYSFGQFEPILRTSGFCMLIHRNCKYYTN